MNELQRTRRFVVAMAFFWVAVTYSVLAYGAVTAFAQEARFQQSPWLFALTGAVALYGAWYWFGYRWLVGTPRAWQSEYLWRRISYWAVLTALGAVLAALDPAFINLMWVSLGVGLSMITFPWSALCVAGPGLTLLYSWGIWPRAGAPQSWLEFAFGAVTMAIYCAVMYLPTSLLRQRFAREKLFSELAQTHAELEAAHAQLARTAEREREIAVLRERERLAREMHDTLGHALALLTVKLEAIRRLYPVAQARAEQEIDATQAVARTAMTELRATLAVLRDAQPALAGVVALRDYAQALADRAGLALACDICPSAATWPADAQAALMRIGAEALNNIEQHAQARSARLALSQADGVATLIVADDGVGLPDLPRDARGELTSPAGHYGLAGMRERVSACAGEFTIASASGAGTTITARLPLHVAAPTPVAPRER